MTVVEPDPERAWQTQGPHFLDEQREYASWKREGVPRPSEETVESVDDLRRQKRFEILTPAACLASLRAGERKVVVLHPLVGGVPLDRAWSGQRRFADEVLAPLRGAAEPA